MNAQDNQKYINVNGTSELILTATTVNAQAGNVSGKVTIKRSVRVKCDK